jgi:hypothetical protein
LIKLPSNVHTTEEHNKEEKPSHVHKEKENTPNTRTGSGQRQLFDPKNPNKPIVVQNSSNLKFQDQGMESPSPPAFPQNPPFQGYGQFYGPQFPEQGMFPGPPMPPQMMPPHGYFFGYPPPQYYEMIRGYVLFIRYALNILCHIRLVLLLLKRITFSIDKKESFSQGN